MQVWVLKSIRAAVIAGTAGCAALGAVTHAQAAVNLVQNGDFETTTVARSDQMNTTNVASWSTSGYNFIFLPGQADGIGTSSGLKLWGANDGGVVNAGGVSQNLGSSPSGGNFIGADGAYSVGAITQTISGLQIGANYLLSFYWAAAQQKNYSGSTAENWTVSLGSQTYTTPTVTNPSKGFTPWMQATYVFTATSATEVLSFLAAGTPSGQPPFSLLDGVSLFAAPEPPTWAVLLVGLAGIGLLGRRGARRLTRG